MFTFPIAHFTNTEYNGTVVFSTAGTTTDFIVPNTTSLQVKVWGAGGGSNPSYNMDGGSGGYSEVTIPVGGANPIQAGDTIKVAVGEGGKVGVLDAKWSVGTAGSGGGYTGLFDTTVTHGNAIVMAGAGGAGAYNGSPASYGGGGGGANLNGLDGEGNLSVTLPTGGTLIAGGSAGSQPTIPDGYAGGALGGGDGSFAHTPVDAQVLAGGTPNAGGTTSGDCNYDDDASLSTYYEVSGGGGGGAGYYGGGGGSAQGGGAGGSGYADLSHVTVDTATSGTTGSTTAPNNGDVDYVAGVGGGGNRTDGGDGLVVIRYGDDII